MSSNKDLWSYRISPRIRNVDRFILLMFTIAGVISVFLLADWWFRPEHVGDWWFYLIFSVIFWYSVIRIILIWINYLYIRKPEQITPAQGLKVAIFTTCTHGEPLSMFEKTLAACRNVTYPHQTYLLTDSDNPEIGRLADRHGANLLELYNTEGAKAGKINRALGMTTEDFILVLDPDHIPFPGFLDNVLGYFQDEKVGFVQVSQAYYNQYRSFTARGAAEQTYTFYGPTQMGLNGLGCSVAIGANCTFRRRALESIGGHGIGLAEDLLTSIRLHAKGWNSVYNPVIVSRGLVPEDFGSFCKQQLKWARGVFEITFVELPALFSKLSFWQKISYTAISTYYLTGLITFFFTLIPFVYFATGAMPAHMSFVEFIIHGSFVVVMALGIYIYAQRWMAHPETERGFHWRGMVLKYACWPVYSLGFLLALVNVEIPYIPTAKKAVTGIVTPFARPLVIFVAAFLITVTIIYLHRRYLTPEGELVMTAEKTWGMLGFMTLALVMTLAGLYAAWGARNLKEEDPWEQIDVENINTLTDGN
ncbi:MAG: glycosyltransferase [Bacteroidetes bacterium]|nr:glycosyltransferase [Bacteroidota bacterium]